MKTLTDECNYSGVVCNAVCTLLQRNSIERMKNGCNFKIFILKAFAMPEIAKIYCVKAINISDWNPLPHQVFHETFVSIKCRVSLAHNLIEDTHLQLKEAASACQPSIQVEAGWKTFVIWMFIWRENCLHSSFHIALNKLIPASRSLYDCLAQL